MTANTSFVRISPQCAFSNGPWDTSPSWTDLTSYHRDDGVLKITRGRSNEFSNFEAGKITGLVLDNRTRVFDPNYTSAPAPFAGNMVPSKQFQIVAEYPWLPGMLPEGPARNTGWSTETLTPYGKEPQFAGINPNLIANGDVEDNITGYTAAGTATIARSSDYAYTGLHSVKVTPGASTYTGVILPKPATVTGQTYTVSCWVYCASSGYSGGINFACDSLGVNSAPSIPANTWTYLTLTGVENGGGGSWYVRSPGASGLVFYVDSVKVEAGAVATQFVPPKYSNQIFNPSFEDGTNNGWGYINAASSIDTTGGLFGPHCQVLTANGAGVMGPYFSGAVNLFIVPGETYTWSIYVKPSVTLSFSANIEWYTGGSVQTGVTVGPITVCPAGQWTRVSGTGIAPAGTAFANPTCYSTTTPGSGVVVRFDAGQFELGNQANPYLDGAQIGGSWDTTTNIDITNPEGASGTSSWTSNASSVQATITQITGISGEPFSTAIQFAFPASANAWAVAQHDYGDNASPGKLVAGHTYTVSFFAKSVSGLTTFVFSIERDDGTNQVMPPVNLTMTSGWSRFTFTFTAQQTSDSQSEFYLAQTSASAAATYQISGVQIEEREYATFYKHTSYTPNASGSTYLDPTYFTTYDQPGITYDQGAYDAGAPNATLSLASGDAPAGVAPQQALKVTVTSGTQAGIVSPVLACKAGQTVTLTTRVKQVSANSSFSAYQVIGINFFQANRSASAVTPTASARIATVNASWGDGYWNSGYLTITVPSDAVTMQVELISTVYQANDVIYFDAVVIDYASQFIQKPISYTYVDNWKIKWQGRDSTCEVQASDALAAFSVKDLESLAWEDQIKNTPNLRHYWTMGERGDWTSGYTQEYAPGTARLIQRYFAGWGVPGPILTDLTTGVGLTDDQTLEVGGWLDDGGGLLVPASTGGWSLGFWIQAAGTTDRILQIGPTNDPASMPFGSSYADFIDIYTSAAVISGTIDNPARSLKFTAQQYTAASNTAANAVSFWFNPPDDVVDPRVPAYTTPGTFYDGAYHFVVIKMAADRQTFSVFVDGVQVAPIFPGGSGSGSGNASGLNAISVNSGTATPAPINMPQGMRGLIGGSNFTPGFTGQTAHWFVVDREMTAAEISTLYNMGQAQWFGQSPQSRLAAILDTVGFPSTKRNLDVGSSTLGAETANLAQTNASQYINYLADTECGWIFIDMGGSVNLLGRLTMVKASGINGTTPQYTLGDLWPQNPASELPLLDTPELDNSNTLIYTEGEGSMGTGAKSSGTARKTSGNLYFYADNATIQTQGKRTISKTNMLNSTEAEVAEVLQYLVNQYKTPKQRLQKIRVMPLGIDELMQFCLTVEIGMVLQVNLRPPPGGSNVTNLLGRVQKVDHTIGRKSWVTEIDVAQVDVGTYINLDNPTLGKLDSGNKLFF